MKQIHPYKYQQLLSHMVIDFTRKIEDVLSSLEIISYTKIPILIEETKRTLANSDEILEIYGAAKDQVLDIINSTYKTSFSHNNWLNYKEDEPAHFLNEMGSNTLNYSSKKTPKYFHVWLIKTAFIIGIEQHDGFNAQHVHTTKTQENKGAGFSFLRNCKSQIFVDDKEKTRTIYLFYKFK